MFWSQLLLCLFRPGLLPAYPSARPSATRKYFGCANMFQGGPSYDHRRQILRPHGTCPLRPLARAWHVIHALTAYPKLAKDPMCYVGSDCWLSGGRVPYSTSAWLGPGKRRRPHAAGTTCSRFVKSSWKRAEARHHCGGLIAPESATVPVERALGFET